MAGKLLCLVDSCKCQFRYTSIFDVYSFFNLEKIDTIDNFKKYIVKEINETKSSESNHQKTSYLYWKGIGWRFNKSNLFISAKNKKGKRRDWLYHQLPTISLWFLDEGLDFMRICGINIDEIILNKSSHMRVTRLNISYDFINFETPLFEEILANISTGIYRKYSDSVYSVNPSIHSKYSVQFGKTYEKLLIIDKYHCHKCRNENEPFHDNRPWLINPSFGLFDDITSWIHLQWSLLESGRIRKLLSEVDISNVVLSLVQELYHTYNFVIDKQYTPLESWHALFTECCSNFEMLDWTMIFSLSSIQFYNVFIRNFYLFLFPLMSASESPCAESKQDKCKIESDFQQSNAHIRELFYRDLNETEQKIIMKYWLGHAIDFQSYEKISENIIEEYISLGKEKELDLLFKNGFLDIVRKKIKS